MFCIWEPHEECLLGSASSVRTRRHACARPRLRFGDLSPISRNLPVRAPHHSQCKKAFFGVKSWLFGHQALFAKHQLRRHLPPARSHRHPPPTGHLLASSVLGSRTQIAPNSHRIRTGIAPQALAGSQHRSSEQPRGPAAICGRLLLPSAGLGCALQRAPAALSSLLGC